MGFKFGGFVASLQKSAKFNSMGVGGYGCVHDFAVNTPSPAEVLYLQRKGPVLE